MRTAPLIGASSSPYGRPCPPGMMPQTMPRPGGATVECAPSVAPPVALGSLGASDGWRNAAAIYGVLSTASMAASVYHGYRRRGTISNALVWGAMGALFPVITPAVALAQGFGEPAPR